VNDSEKLLHLPVLPIKNTVLFPYLLMPLAVGRPVSRAAVEAALATEDKTLLIVAQRDADVEEPAEKDLYTIGTRAVIKKMARSENGLEMIVQGLERVVLVRLEQTTPYLKAMVRPLSQPDDQGTEVEALHRAVIELAGRAMAIAQPQTPIDVSQVLAQARDPRSPGAGAAAKDHEPGANGNEQGATRLPVAPTAPRHPAGTG
jgi:ATP-dependent Lon protease